MTDPTPEVLAAMLRDWLEERGYPPAALQPDATDAAALPDALLEWIGGDPDPQP